METIVHVYTISRFPITYLFFKTAASDWLVGMLNGFPARASSTLVRAFFIDCKLRHSSTRVSPARKACKLSVFVFKKSFYKEDSCVWKKIKKRRFTFISEVGSLPEGTSVAVDTADTLWSDVVV